MSLDCCLWRETKKDVDNKTILIAFFEAGDDGFLSKSHILFVLYSRGEDQKEIDGKKP
jgi:hypothetical protein